MTPYILAISFWLHLFGIIMWVGAALLMPLVAWPATRVLTEPARQAFRAAYLKQLTPWILIAFPLIILTGLVQVQLRFGFSYLLEINPLSLKLLVFVMMWINSGNGIRLREKL